MSPEIYTIIGVAIGLAALILNGQRPLADLRRELGELRSEMHREIGGLRKEIDGLREEMHREIAGLRKEIDGLRKEIDGLRKEIAALAERVARLEGIFAGPRETAVGEGT